MQIKGFERVLMLAFSKCTCSTTTEGASCRILLGEYFLWASKGSFLYYACRGGMGKGFVPLLTQVIFIMVYMAIIAYVGRKGV